MHTDTMMRAQFSSTVPKDGSSLPARLAEVNKKVCDTGENIHSVNAQFAQIMREIWSQLIAKPQTACGPKAPQREPQKHDCKCHYCGLAYPSFDMLDGHIRRTHRAIVISEVSLSTLHTFKQ